MTGLTLHEFHQGLNARFTQVGGAEAVDHYGDPLAEHAFLTHAAGVLDLSFRSRLCLTGTDRHRFLNGQVTNQVQRLAVGQGCYAALVTAKGRMVSDLNIYCLTDELLLDFEPGLDRSVTERLEKYIIADDVAVVNVAPHYGLLSIQGPKAGETLAALGLGLSAPVQRMSFSASADPTLGELYCMNVPRGAAEGFDLFIPVSAVAAVLDKLIQAARQAGGGVCGWQALEMARIEAGMPRYGADMDESNLAPETGLAEQAISYDKGCYIGQEVIARIRTYGQVAKAFRGLLLPADLAQLPARGEKLLHAGHDAGYVTSALVSPAFHRKVALGYVRRECNQPGTELQLATPDGLRPVQVVSLPFRFDRS